MQANTIQNGRAGKSIHMYRISISLKFCTECYTRLILHSGLHWPQNWTHPHILITVLPSYIDPFLVWWTRFYHDSSLDVTHDVSSQTLGWEWPRNDWVHFVCVLSLYSQLLANIMCTTGSTLISNYGASANCNVHIKSLQMHGIVYTPKDSLQHLQHFS